VRSDFEVNCWGTDLRYG